MRLHIGWLLDVVSRSEGAYGRVVLTLTCGCTVVRLASAEPKRARCEKQPQCKWIVKEVACAS
jgi:hypothetical protein